MRLRQLWLQPTDCEECRPTQKIANSRPDNNTPETFH